jgi:hypothetical protein
VPSVRALLPQDSPGEQVAITLVRVRKIVFRSRDRVLNLGLENASETDKTEKMQSAKWAAAPGVRNRKWCSCLFEIALGYAKRDGAHPT